MADDNLKDWTVGWVVTGLLFFCLLSFSVVFMFNNNPTNGLSDDTAHIFTETSTEFENRLVETPEDANTLLNISANTNPEGNFLGSRDSVATSFSQTGTAKGFWESSRLMFSWVFSGTVGQLLLGVIGGIIGLLSIFYITKWIRIGG